MLTWSNGVDQNLCGAVFKTTRPKSKHSRLIPEDNDADRPPLFRPEALRAAGETYGSPVELGGVKSWVLTAFLLAVIAAIVAFMLFGQYTRKETVSGNLTPPTGSARLVLTRDAVVSELFVAEGQRVDKGQPIARLTYDEISEAGERVGDLLVAAGDAERAALSQQGVAQAQETSSRIAELTAQKAGLAAQAETIQGDLELQADRIQLANETLSAARTLFDKGLMPALQLRQREEAVLAARQTLNSLNREAGQLRAEIEQTSAQLASTQAAERSRVAGLAASMARLDERRASTQGDARGALIAPRAGTVAALQTRVGEPVAAGTTLAVILPIDRTLQAELWVPSRAAGFLETGHEVRLMFDAFPYQRFGNGKGRVVLVSKAPVAARDQQTPSQTGEPLFRVVVAMDENSVQAYGRRWPLQPGMTLKADIVLDRRPIWAWVLNPLLAISRRS